MQAAMPISHEDAVRDVTLAAHSQAVEHAIQAMHTHLHQVLTLEDMASVAYLSPFHFNRVFRHLTGIPPGEFLSALRFQAARRLLLTTSLSVTDICFEVGYTSLGSFTSRFTQLVGLSPRLLRQRAQAFEPLSIEDAAYCLTMSSCIPLKNALQGWISAPASFRGTIYVGLFTSPIPQGRPVRCTSVILSEAKDLNSPGWYLLNNIPDGIYYLRTAAFPVATDLHTALLPGEKMLVGKSACPLVVRHGHVFGDADLALHPPRLTDPPLVMGLPLL